MREDQRSHHLHNHQRNKLSVVTTLFTRTTAYVIVVLLSYALGYLSRPSPPRPTQEASPPPPPSVFQLANLPTQLDNFRITAHCSNSPLPPHLVFPTILDLVFNGSSPYANFPPPHLSPSSRKTLQMVNVTRKLGLQTQILCLGDFREWPGFRDRFNMINGDVLLLQQFMQNVVYFNATGSVLPVPFSTGSGLEKLCEWGIAADLLEINAGHDFISVWGDKPGVSDLRPGGVIFGHDYFTAADNRG
ncbi:GRF1-INTERACTING FACTOR 2 family protein [Hibiscus syriacus]|uniref:GRF1-INTERACTING FACTOR 2 family protein n=1 Tax=Hibiscus syriacus TaxID=106335 RepID=A0A6A3A949_HIBSY|nr:GRF1-INTERACTING FACTOR 2 family protein [Hibiscus syriacus]